MKAKWDVLLSALLVMCALVTTTLVVRREFFQTTIQRQPERPSVVSEWPFAIDSYQRIGPPGARVTLVEFADFECPFCAAFEKTLTSMRKRHPNDLSIGFVYLPIPSHRFAVPAARVAECAADQGRFEAMHDRLFEGQEALGLKAWDDFATEAGIPDIPAFDICIKKTEAVRRVEAGQELGKRVGVQATPTVILNGWKLSQPPTESELESMIAAVLAGKSPVPGTT